MIKFFKVLLKVIGWILVFIGVFGGLATFTRNFMEPTFYVVIAIYLGLAWLCFWASKKLSKAKQKKGTETPAVVGKKNNVQIESAPKPLSVTKSSEAAVFSKKEELLGLIADCDKLATLFSQSSALASTGDGRTMKMVQTMMSYKCIFIYLYSSFLKYGNANAFLQNDAELSGRYAVSCSMVFNNPQARANCFMLLPANWKDVIQVLDSMKLAGEHESVARYDSITDALTNAFNKISKLK